MEPIAVIGLALRFSGDAVSEESFWKVMMEKRCTMTEWPESRINIDAFHKQGDGSKSLISARGANLLDEDPMLFDAPFFSISTTEAAALDPQQCLLLETAYQALENAGIPLDTIKGSNTGVYTGCMNDDHKTLLARDIDLTPKYSAIGVSPSMLANRISWMFDLKGPSMNLDSACSSSLMALDIACQALRSGDTSMAFVGGVNIILGVESSIGMSKMGIISPDGISHSFDERANGFARGEGIGIVILKKLSDAVKDNDTIRAVVRSTASNQDGRTPGITQPSKDSQEELIRHTYAKAGLDCSLTRYFEAHGTGTPIGDPIEALAIASVFSEHRTKSDPLFIGAMKPNFGHTEGASGIAGFIKTVMVLENGTIPPIANLEVLNPRMQAHLWNLDFVREAKQWPDVDIRRASVNAFGFGGSNTHVVLDDAKGYLASKSITGHYSGARKTHTSTNGIQTNGIQTNGTKVNGIQTNGYHTNGYKSNGFHKEKEEPYILSWSAHDELALQRMTADFSKHLQRGCDEPYLQQLAYTLSCRRNVFGWRSFAVVRSVEDLSQLEQLASPRIRAGREQGAVFVFTGQGAQYQNMGVELLHWKVFRETLESFDDSLTRLGCTWSVFDVLQSDSDKIHRPECSQPLCTALQIALVDLLRSFGCLPSAVLGHSSGEIAAAYAVGGIDLESACKISFYRGQFAAKICESAQAGSMLAVGLSELDVLPYLETSQTSLACINSPSNVTIAGAQAEIQALHARLEAAGIFSKELKTGVAYHSPIMSSVADEYAESITSLTRPEGPYVITSIASTVTGELVSDLAVFTDAQYWVRNLVSPVKFSQALLCLTARPKGARKLGKKAQVELHDIVEIGPSAALKRPIMETLTQSKQQLRYWSSLSRSDSPVSHMLGLVGQMFCLGYKVDLASVNRIDPSKRHRTLTDLPQYSFSHLRSYWHEGTLSAQTRRRHHFPRPLLGAPVADWNPLEPKWRQYLSVQALPWLADHRVDGAILLPGAAMIVLVLEAALQMAPSDATIKGYHIKEASFSSPIIIPYEEDEYAEVETHYRPLWSPLANGSTWSEVRIYVRSRGSEAIHESCRAVVQVEFEHLKTGLDTGAEKLVHTSLLKERYHELASRCEKAVDPKSVYRTYDKMGLQYGPFFRGLMQPTWNGVDTCKANIMLSDMEGSVDDSSDFLIHPATLDILAHLMWVPLTNGGTCAVPTALPTRIRDAWISNTGLRNNRVHSMHGVARSFKRDFRVIEGTAVLLNDAEEPVLSLGSLEFTTISRPGPNSKETRFQPLCFSVRTRPDIDLIDKKSMAQLIQPIQTHCHSEAMFNLDLHQALRWFIDSALCQLQCDTENLQPHMQRYVDWMRLQCKRYPDLDSALMDDVAEREKLLVRIEAANDRGKVFVAFGRQLLSIISGEVDPLEVLFSSGLAEGFYADLVQSVSAGKKLWRYLDALAFKNPSLKILEVGAGTGSMTPFVVAPLLSGANTSDAFPRISKYDFTDVSAGFFEKAKEKLAPTVPLDRFDFKVFDLESDPETQTLEASSYDLIVAASVIHATKDLKSTLARLRLLLKPAGKLILFEVVRPECIRAAFIFGTLPGWWLSTDSKDNYREAGPNITGDQWREVLAETGFSVDAMVRDHEEDLCHEFGFIFASAVEEAKSVNVTRRETTLIVSPNRDMRNDLCSALRSSLETMGWPKCRTLSLDEVRTPHDLTGHRIVVIAEMEDPVLCNLSESHYNAVNLIASSGKGILWVTRTGEGTDQYADFQMINGLARVCRTENPNRAFVTLALQDRKAVQSSAATLSKVLQKLDETGWSTEHSEMEYIERDDMLHIRRLMEEEDMDQSIQSKIMPRLREELFGSASPLALTVHSPGLLDSLCFVADTEAGSDLQLQPEEILVDVRAIGLNFRDVLIALGALDSDRLGVECTGVVRQAGRQATVQPGDRVIVANMGCARALVKCNSQVVVKIPEDMTFEEAASFPTAGVTAYYSLIEMGRIQQGETILIHAGAGGTGQMCIQLAQMVGCEVYTTTSSQSKKDFLMSTYGIPSDHIFYSRNASFAQAITQATNGRGVDVLVNSLAGDSLVASWELMAPHGRFIELGRADIKGNSNLPMMTFEKNVSFIAVAIDYICDHRPALLAKMLRAVTEMLVRGDLKLPSPRRNYSVSEVTDAFRYLQSGASVGKIVLTIEPSDVVQTYRIQKSQWTFPKDATYIIAGGLGGLGRSTARWMVSKGATHLVLLSRSGPVTKAAKELLEDLCKDGAVVEAPRCDVSSEGSLRAVLNHVAETMPPIKGCIQGTMVLRDALFEKMSYSDWIAATHSKTTASWNLHKHLPAGMDFFVLLSSLCGIVGNLGQANYAAGNTYQDALAQHRVLQGEKATSLDIGAMASVGIIAENIDFIGLMGHDEDVIRVVQENEFHSVLDIYLGPDAPAAESEMGAQALVGMSTPQVYIDKGIELPSLLSQRLYASIARLGSHSSDMNMSGSRDADGINYPSLFRSASSIEDASSVVISALTSKLSRALSVAPEDLDPSKPLHQYGVDSLVAVELRNWFGKEFEASVTVLKIMNAVDVRAVAALVVAESTVTAHMT